MHRKNEGTGGRAQSMGRPPTVSDAELMLALRRALDWPAIAAVDTAEVSGALNSDVSQQTVRNRLLAAHEADDVSIAGVRPGGQGGWAWWLTDESLY